MLIRKRIEVGHPMKPYRTIAAGLELAFDLVQLDGETVLGCYVPDDHPSKDALAKVYAAVPGYDVIHAPGSEPPAPVPSPIARLAAAIDSGIRALAPVAAKVEADVREILPVAQTAITNGWMAVDLEGTGRNGQPGPEGGCSPTTGLTLAQMALTVPPDDWEAKRATLYPWEIDGWRPPGLDWVAPTAPSKRKPEETKAEPEKPEPVDVPRAPEGEPEEDGDEEGPTAYDRAIAKGAEADAAKAADADPDLDPAVAAGYPADQVVAARAFAQALAAATPGKPLHPNRFNYAVKKRAKDEPSATPISTATESQLAGLLR